MAGYSCVIDGWAPSMRYQDNHVWGYPIHATGYPTNMVHRSYFFAIYLVTRVLSWRLWVGITHTFAGLASFIGEDSRWTDHRLALGMLQACSRCTALIGRPVIFPIARFVVPTFSVLHITILPRTRSVSWKLEAIFYGRFWRSLLQKKRGFEGVFCRKKELCRMIRLISMKSR